MWNFKKIYISPNCSEFLHSITFSRKKALSTISGHDCLTTALQFSRLCNTKSMFGILSIHPTVEEDLRIQLKITPIAKAYASQCLLYGFNTGMWSSINNQLYGHPPGSTSYLSTASLNKTGCWNGSCMQPMHTHSHPETCTSWDEDYLYKPNMKSKLQNGLF